MTPKAPVFDLFIGGDGDAWRLYIAAGSWAPPVLSTRMDEHREVFPWPSQTPITSTSSCPRRTLPTITGGRATAASRASRRAVGDLPARPAGKNRERGGGSTSLTVGLKAQCARSSRQSIVARVGHGSSVSSPRLKTGRTAHTPRRASATTYACYSPESRSAHDRHHLVSRWNHAAWALPGRRTDNPNDTGGVLTGKRIIRCAEGGLLASAGTRIFELDGSA